MKSRSDTMKGFGAKATILVLLGLSTGVISMGIGSNVVLKTVGLGTQGEDVQTLKKIDEDVKRVCKLGTTAPELKKEVSFSKKIKLKLQTEDLNPNDNTGFYPEQAPEHFQASKVKDGEESTLWSSLGEGKINSCKVVFEPGSHTTEQKATFKQSVNYMVKVRNDGEASGNPVTKIEVTQ